MKKILITGASGFAGGYLCEYLKKLNQFEIYGTYFSEEEFKRSSVRDIIHFSKIDLADESGVLKLVSDIRPDYVVHLAAASSPKDSFASPAFTFQVNVNSEINLLEAIRKNNLTDTKILIISSSEVYGYVKPEQLPVSESSELRPATPYAVSKIAQDFLGLQYYLSYKLRCIRVRPFNHIGPRQSAKFVVSDFCKQIAEIEKADKEPIIYVGNLSAKRDFTDVRDVVEGYYMLLDKGVEGEVYNIGSGRSLSAKEILDILVGLSTKKIEVLTDEQKFRPVDIPDIFCDNKKVFELTGWRPKIETKQTLKDTLDYWRNMV